MFDPFLWSETFYALGCIIALTQVSLDIIYRAINTHPNNVKKHTAGCQLDLVKKKQVFYKRFHFQKEVSNAIKKVFFTACILK